MGGVGASTRVQLGRPAGGWRERSRCGVRGDGAGGSLARLMDVLVDVLSRGQLGDARLGLLVGHLGSCRGEVLIPLHTTQPARRRHEVHESRFTEAGYYCILLITIGDEAEKFKFIQMSTHNQLKTDVSGDCDKESNLCGRCYILSFKNNQTRTVLINY